MFRMDNDAGLTFWPLTMAEWPDFERLFGARGACGGCWCMNWYVSRATYNRQKGDGNKQAMQALVATGREPGILVYVEGAPAGWIALAPREAYPVLARSRILKPVDNSPVWSIVCFFIAKAYRGRGLSVALLKAAIEHVRERGGQVLEGYPHDPQGGEMPPVFVFTGLLSAFRQAGFIEVARRSVSRPVMRYTIPSVKLLNNTN